MDVAVAASRNAVDPFQWLLLRRMLGPLSGIAQTIGFATRARLEPRLAIAGGDLTGVHLLRGTPPPQVGAYHIGGSGTTYGEALIRTLGETVERYAQFASLVSGRQRTRMASVDEIRMDGRRVLAPSGLRFFSDGQLARSRFPFSPVHRTTRVAWLESKSLIDGAPVWAPAQLALVAYVRDPDEPQYGAGVTTGSAAHRRLDLAVRNALLELIQIDAAMGHWYGRQAAVLISPGPRTRSVDRVVRTRLHPDGPVPTFYWLPSPDLPGLAVACLLTSPAIPRVAVGLGADLRLDRAMYRAFLEAAAVAQLAKVILFRRSLEDGAAAENEPDPNAIYNLDANVGYYAMQERDVIRARFGGTQTAASDLPPDVDASTTEDVRRLVAGFRDSGKELIFLDLTTTDIRSLGFCVVRLWSPDVLTLSLPSAPPVLHSRFADYGGVTHEAPHPYP